MTTPGARFDAIVIDPNPATRAALKELLHNEQRFGEYVYRGVFLFTSPFEAIPKIMDGEGADVILISDRLPFDEIQRFIRGAKEMEGERGVAYIVVLEATGQKRIAVSEGLAYGADGFLQLPCSISSLREITDIANRVKAESQARRIKIALKLLVETLIDEIEFRAKKLYYNDQMFGYGRQLKSAVKRLLGDEAMLFDSYVEILEEALRRMPPIVMLQGYSGSSRRVREMYEGVSRHKEGVAARPLHPGPVDT